MTPTETRPYEAADPSLFQDYAATERAHLDQSARELFSKRNLRDADVGIHESELKRLLERTGGQ